jgi:hypothetical protein
LKSPLTNLSTILVICLVMAVLPAIAQTDIYDNGPINGTVDAWTIGDGFSVSDSFIIPIGPPCCKIRELDFAAWLSPGDTLISAEVSITSSEFGGTTYFDQIVNFTATGCASNQIGFDLCTEEGTFDGPTLGAGTYWLNLQNGTTTSGDPVYWDENSGPSMASENDLGTIPSESFTILGDTNGSTPEPGSILLFGSGVTVLASLWRRKLHRW